MPEPESLSRIRRHQRADRNQTRFAQSLLVLFRAIFRVQEIFAPPQRRQKLRQLRERMQAIDTDKKGVQEQIQHGKVREGLDAMQERYARPEDRGRRDGHREKMQAIHQESDALRDIAQAAGDDRAVAAHGYREYLALHPDSALAHKYLGHALHTLGDGNGSLQEHREAVRLAGSDSIHGASARIDIAKILQEQGQTEAALAELQSVIEEATPKTQYLVCMAFLQLGNTYHTAGQRQQARAAWKQAARWDTTTLIRKKAQELLKAYL